MFVMPEECVLVVTAIDRPKGLIKAMGWSWPRKPMSPCVLDLMCSRQLARFHLAVGGEGALHCAAYVIDYRTERREHGLTLHHITLAVDGALWREDDTPVAGFNALWGINCDAMPIPLPSVLAAEKGD